MPKTWDDLLNPRFKGKLVMTNPSFTSLQLGVVAMMAKARGWDFFEKLNNNDVMVVQGNEQALNLVKTGERPIAAGADSQYANEARLAGHKIQNVFPSRRHLRDPGDHLGGEGRRRTRTPPGCSPNTPEPGGPEAVAAESGIYAARTDVEPPAGSPPIRDIKVIPMDYAYIQRVRHAGEEEVQRDLLGIAYPSSSLK